MAKKNRRWNQVTTIHSFKALKLIRVFGIARVSTDKQAKKIGESLDHQKQVLENWVKAKSSLHYPQEWKLSQIYVENEDKDGVRRGRSATTREGRLGLAKALELARARLIDVIVVTKLDRIARDVKDYMDISAEFNQNQVALVCLDLDIDTSTPDGQMIMRNHANLAQWQAERIAQYSLETVRRHVDQGRPIGPPPLGYNVAKNKDGKSTFIFDERYKEHVKLMESLYLQLESIDQVVSELHKKGFKSPRGKTYSKPQVARILQNIRYTGRQEYDGKVLEGNWPRMRSDEVQEKMLRILKKNWNARHTSRKIYQKYPYLLQGILKCHRCHSGMIPRPGTGGRQDKYYPYYACMKADKTRGIDCELIYLPAESTDKAVIEFINNLRLESKMIEDAVQSANQSTAGRINELQKDWERIKVKLKDIRTQVANLVDILAEKGVSQLASIKEKLEISEVEEKTLLEEEQRVAMEINAERAQAGAAHEQIQTLKLFNDFCQLYKAKPDKIKMLLPRFISYVVCHIIDKKKGIGRLDVGLFGRPFNVGVNAEVWNNALTELAGACNEATAKAYKSGDAGLSGNMPSAAKIHSALVASQLDKACGTEGCGFAAEEQMGSSRLLHANNSRGKNSPCFATEEQMGRSTGFEPATLGSTNRCSNQLSYDRHETYRAIYFVYSGKPNL